MKEAGFCRKRTVHALFTSPPFFIYRRIRRRWNESSFYLCFCLIFFRNFDMYLLFILWNPVEHNRPLFCLALSCFLPLTLILSTLLNFLYSCSLRLEYQKGYINSGITHCIKNFMVAMTIDYMGCVAEANFFSLNLQEYLVHPDLIKGKVDPNASYNYFLCNLDPFLYTY